jgi:alpha-galactosidase
MSSCMQALLRAGIRFAAFLILPMMLLMAASGATATEPAATPPMGWNSWNHFADKINDATVRAQADALVSSGLRDAGYVYVNVDDTWQGERDLAGNIHSNARFPDMKALADFVHGKGLKFGLYSSPGAKTCAGFQGSLGHEQQDAETYAAWGVDFLKYDLCSFQDEMRKAKTEHPNDPDASKNLLVAAYRKMGDALKATGRPMLYSVCEYGVDRPWMWGPEVGANLWRTTNDIHDSYERMIAIGFGQAGLSQYAGPGHWNDPDMLEVGNGGMNPQEYRTHISLWAMLAAPLLAGNDLTRMTRETLALLGNREVIAIDQDDAGHQGERVRAGGHIEVWVRLLADGSTVVGLFNLSRQPQTVQFDYREFGFEGRVKVRDIWANKNLGELSGKQHLGIWGHDVILLNVKP